MSEMESVMAAKIFELTSEVASLRMALADLSAAVLALWDATCENHLTAPSPVKYGTCYRELVKLNDARVRVNRLLKARP